MEKEQEETRQLEELWEPDEAAVQKKKKLFWWEIMLFILGGAAVISAFIIIAVKFWETKREGYSILEHSMAVLCVKQVPEEFAEDEVSILEDFIVYSNMNQISDYSEAQMLSYNCRYIDSASDWLEAEADSMDISDMDDITVLKGTYTNNKGRDFEYISVARSYDIDGTRQTSDFLGFATELGDGEVVTVTFWNAVGKNYVPEDYFKYLDTGAFEITSR